MREFITYTDATGYDPVTEYLAGIPVKAAGKIYDLLAALVHIERLGRPYLKHFAGFPFWLGELIIGDYRIFVHRLPSEPGDERYLLLHGFRKKSLDTPKREIDRAIRYVLDHYEQEGQNT